MSGPGSGIAPHDGERDGGGFYHGERSWRGHGGVMARRGGRGSAGWMGSSGKLFGRSGGAGVAMDLLVVLVLELG